MRGHTTHALVDCSKSGALPRLTSKGIQALRLKGRLDGLSRMTLSSGPKPHPESVEGLSQDPLVSCPLGRKLIWAWWSRTTLLPRAGNRLDLIAGAKACINFSFARRPSDVAQNIVERFRI